MRFLICACRLPRPPLPYSAAKKKYGRQVNCDDGLGKFS
ncbi:unnamed protein product [Larinioides sclopetarius]|uniref:Uncharacterized protein n=1 Tax=Larinioides sclopetarius TaxID=280406 RepID=A0AAV1ZB10_9ARAC